MSPSMTERRNRPVVTGYEGQEQAVENEDRLRQMLQAIGQDFCPRCKSMGSSNVCVDRMIGTEGVKVSGDHPERHQWYRAYGLLVASQTVEPLRDAAFEAFLGAGGQRETSNLTWDQFRQATWEASTQPDEREALNAALVELFLKLGWGATHEHITDAVLAAGFRRNPNA